MTLPFDFEGGFEVEVEVWSWCLKLKFEVEVWSWKDLGSLQHRGDEALTLRVAGANSNLKNSMM